MKNIIKKIGGLCLGLALLSGVAVGISSTKAKEVKAESTITINYDDTFDPAFPASGGNTSDTAHTDTTASNFAFKEQGIYKSESNKYLMFVQNKGFLYNTGSLGTITSVAVTYTGGTSTTGKTGVYFGSSAISSYTTSSNATIAGQSKTDTWTNSTKNLGYFQLSTSNKNVQITQIVIKYESTPTKTVTGLTWKTGTDMTKKNYFVGDNWDLSGLELTVTYDDTSTETIGINKCNDINVVPTSPTLGTTEISVSCSYGDVDSGSITISGISVEAAPLSTVIDTTVTTYVNGTPTADLLSYKNGDQIFNSNKNTSQTGANNYYPGDQSSHSSTRSYNGMILEFDSGAGNVVTGVEVTCATTSYATTLAGFSWPAGSVSTNDKIVKFTATTPTKVITVNVTATFGYESIKIFYKESTQPSVLINRPTEHLQSEDEGTFTASTDYATNPTITWSSSDDDILMVDGDGSYLACSYGVVTLTASLICDESPTTPITDTCEVIVDAGLISIADANEIASALTENTKFKVTISGFITDLDANSGKTNAFTLSNKKIGETGADSIMIYGIYDSSEYRSYCIINGTATFTGNLSKYNTTNELVSPVLDDYSDDAISFSQTANEGLSSKYADCLITSGDWETLEGLYNDIDSYAKAVLVSATSAYAKSDVASWVQHYDVIVAKLHYSNFMNRSTSGVNITNPNVFNSNASTWIIIAVSLAGLTAIGGYFFYKKRKENF